MEINLIHPLGSSTLPAENEQPFFDWLPLFMTAWTSSVEVTTATWP